MPECSARSFCASLRSLVDQVKHGVYRQPLDGCGVLANDQFASILGYESVRQVETEFDWQQHIELQARAEFLRSLDAATSHIEREQQMRRCDGAAIVVVETARLVRDDQGHPLYYQGTLADVTEPRRVEAEMQKSQRLEAIGRLAGSVAHDFNNLLTIIFACVDEVAEQTTRTTAPAELAEIRAAAERAAALTRQLLAFSRKQQLQPLVVDLNEALVEVEPLVRRLIGEDVQLEVLHDRATGPVLLDPHQFEQVIVNLAANARDAMPAGGRLTIWTSSVRVGERSQCGIAAGDYTQVCIQDSGTGMTPEVKERVFEPFFSTKGSGGTGLGLATVYGIVAQSGGSIHVDSEPGQGTTFTLCFPVSRAAVEPRRPQPERCAAPATGSGALLLVEDEEAVRTMVAIGLRRRGYAVLEAGSAEEAAALAASRDFDLLLTDVVLPDANGGALAGRLRQARPDLAVVFISGHSAAEMRSRGQLPQDAAFVQKPFSWEDLHTAIHTELERTARQPNTCQAAV